ncbi:MAG: hypothetical protein Q9220_003244 [cf. Caloplaca sp. 1 TL-2023]
MSFLNSVLGTIGKDRQQIQLPQPRSPAEPTSQASAEHAPTVQRLAITKPQAPAVGQKRKAEDQPSSVPNAKGLKTTHEQELSGGTPSSADTSSTKKSKRPSIAISKSALTISHRGTDRPSPVSTSPDTPTTDTPKAAPKKGSYAEVMARAAANRNSSVGIIKHKPKEAISAKKEIMMSKKGFVPKIRPGSKDTQHSTAKLDRNSPLPSPAKPKSPALSGKKPPTASYKGTAAPKPQPAYKGTMKPGRSVADTARKKDPTIYRSRSNSLNPSRRGRDLESEGEEEEEEENSYTDDSDDMEAGFSDVEKEETVAMKEAKKEDEEQLRIENQWKKVKDERRKTLEAMAAKAPKQRY